MSRPAAVQAVIFDRDGVLTDFDLAAAERFFAPRLGLSIWEIFGRWEALGRARGFPATVAAEQAFFRDFWNSLADDLGIADAVRAELHAFDYATCLTVYPDVLPALAAARAAGLRIGVLSNFALASLDHSLLMTGLAPWIDAACAATVIGAAKPDPAAYAAAAARLGVTPADCLFFDDERVCVEGARAVGMAAYQVDRRRADHDLAAGLVADLSALARLVGRV